MFGCLLYAVERSATLMQRGFGRVRTVGVLSCPSNSIRGTYVAAARQNR
jgi:hypothetical protein